MAKLAIPKEPGTSQMRPSLSQPPGYSFTAWQLSALPTPVVSSAVASLPHSIYKQAQGNFRLWLDSHSWVQWCWWKRLQSPAPLRCLSKQTSNTWAVLTSHCPCYLPLSGPLTATFSPLPQRTALILYFFILWIESKIPFS